MTTTHPTFDHIEAALCTPAAIAGDWAFHLEVALRQPDPSCDELPSHDELLTGCGLDCTADEFLAWCDWRNERQEVIDRDDMAAYVAPIAA